MTNASTTQNRWEIDGLAFTVLMEAMGRDRLPYPLSYRPDFVEHEEDYQRLRMRAAQKVDHMFGHRMYDAMATLLEPEVRVEIHGFHGQDHAQVVRIHAGLHGSAATIAHQLPSQDREIGRDVILSTIPASQLASRLIDLLPACPAGTRPRFSAKRSDLDEPVYTRHPTALSPVEKTQKFLRRPRCGTGEITVYPGSAPDARPTSDGLAFLWMDYPSDGRYLLTHHSPEEFTIVPASPSEFTQHLNTRMRTLLASRRP